MFEKQRVSSVLHGHQRRPSEVEGVDEVVDARTPLRHVLVHERWHRHVGAVGTLEALSRSHLDGRLLRHVSHHGVEEDVFAVHAGIHPVHQAPGKARGVQVVVLL